MQTAFSPAPTVTPELLMPCRRKSYQGLLGMRHERERESQYQITYYIISVILSCRQLSSLFGDSATRQHLGSIVCIVKCVIFITLRGVFDE